MRRPIFEKMIIKLYPELNIRVISYEILEKHKYENGEWVLDRPAVFVQIECDHFDSTDLNLTNYFTNFTGFEFSISCF